MAWRWGVVDNYDDLENVNIHSFLANCNTGNLVVISGNRSTVRLGDGIEVNAIEMEERIQKSAHRNETELVQG